MSESVTGPIGESARVEIVEPLGLTFWHSDDKAPRFTITEDQVWACEAGSRSTPIYEGGLFGILGVTLAERALFGRPARRPPSRYGRAFGAAFPAMFFVASALLMALAEREALKQAPGSLIAPLLAAAAPFVAGGAAVIPAAAAAAPLAFLWKAGGA